MSNNEGLTFSTPLCKWGISSFFINSRTAIAEAIIGLLLVFYNSKNLNCIGALSFYDSKRSIGEVLFFFNQFYWSEFLSGK